jgi:hypothetical protein
MWVWVGNYCIGGAKVQSVFLAHVAWLCWLCQWWAIVLTVLYSGDSAILIKWWSIWWAKLIWHKIDQIAPIDQIDLVSMIFTGSNIVPSQIAAIDQIKIWQTNQLVHNLAAAFVTKLLVAWTTNKFASRPWEYYSFHIN